MIRQKKCSDEKSDLFCFAPPPSFLRPSVTNYMLLYSTLLCKKIARALGGVKIISPLRWGEDRIDWKSRYYENLPKRSSRTNIIAIKSGPGSARSGPELSKSVQSGPYLISDRPSLDPLSATQARLARTCLGSRTSFWVFFSEGLKN